MVHIFSVECGDALQIIWSFKSLQASDDKLNLTAVISERNTQKSLLLHVEGELKTSFSACIVNSRNIYLLN